MTIRMACPTCGKTIKAPDAMAGKAANCPSCNELIKLSDPSPIDVTSEPRPRETLKQCKDCGGNVSKSATKCPHCGAKIVSKFTTVAAIGCLAMFLLPIGCMTISFLRFTPPPWDQSDNSSMALIQVQKLVKRQLKSPGSAEWPGALDTDTRVMSAGEHTYRIHSWVDSQNAFGAKIRTTFDAAITQTGDRDWQLISLETQ